MISVLVVSTVVFFILSVLGFVAFLRLGDAVAARNSEISALKREHSDRERTLNRRISAIERQLEFFRLSPEEQFAAIAYADAVEAQSRAAKAEAEERAKSAFEDLVARHPEWSAPLRCRECGLDLGPPEPYRSSRLSSGVGARPPAMRRCVQRHVTALHDSDRPRRPGF